MHKDVAHELGFQFSKFILKEMCIKGAESNCSRVARICWKYQIPPTIFFNHYLKIGKDVTRSFFKFEVASHLNSYTDKTIQYEQAINELVGLPIDKVHSYSYLHSILDGQARGLLSESKKWCPECYRERFVEGESENGVYDDLYWSVDSINHCLLHGAGLLKKCPRCFSKQPYVSTSVEPGYCHHCLGFLGDGFSASIDEDSLDGLNEVFTLFYVDTYEGVRPSFVSLVDNLKALKRAYPEASNKYLGDLMGTSEDVVKKWMAGKRKPQISTLFALHRALGLFGPHQLFYPTDIFISKVILSKSLSLKFNTRSEFAGMVKEKEIVDSFRAMISGAEPTVSRASFASTHEVTEGFLESRFSSYCEQLTRAHEARLAEQKEERKKDLVAQLAIALGRVRSKKKSWTIDNAIECLNDPTIVEGVSKAELVVPFGKAKIKLREADSERKKKQLQRDWA